MNRFEKVLLSIFFVELFIGGGGRLIDFGFLSIRQVLFLLILATFFCRIIRNKNMFSKEVNTFLDINFVSIGVYALLMWFCVSAIVGFFAHHKPSIIMMDILRVSFLILYFPLAYYISESRYTRDNIVVLLKISSIIVSFFTLIITVLGKFVFLENFDAFYDFINSIMNDDLFFRLPSHSVFYKSHFFVLMAFILSLYSVLNKRYKILDVINVILGFSSLILSETRGFVVVIMLVLVFMLSIDMKIFTDSISGMSNKLKAIFQSKLILHKMLITVLLLIILPYLYNHMTVGRFETNTSSGSTEVNDVSIGARKEFILASKPLILSDVSSFTIGKGYGTSIGGRENGIEMSFLDILVEQGIIGLILWLYISFCIYYNYHIRYKGNYGVDDTDIGLLSCITALLFLTNINPFINNPLGIGFLISVLIISKNKNSARSYL